TPTGTDTTGTVITIQEDLILTNDDKDFTRIVVIAIDQSDYSRYAFDWAVNNFLRRESDLVVLVNVRQIPSEPGPFAAGYLNFSDVMTSLEDQNKLESHELLHEFAAKLKAEKFACKAIATRGDARDEIVRKVSELKADVLILGYRGLGAIKRADI
ncbi:1690_t:CDS:2, partial [Diversispora eburnea]